MYHYQFHKNILDSLFDNIKFLDIDGQYTKTFYKISLNTIKNTKNYNIQKVNNQLNSYAFFDFYLNNIFQENNVDNINQLLDLKNIKQPQEQFNISYDNEIMKN